MEESPSKRFPLSINLSPMKFENFNFLILSDFESDRTPCNSKTSELNDLKAQLDIVNEDRERLKLETDKLKQEREGNFFKLISHHFGPRKLSDFEKISNLQLQIEKLRKDCEEKDRLLCTMKNLLGNNELNHLFKENQETKSEPNPKANLIHRSNTKLPCTKQAISHYNRSISPYQKII